MERGRRSPAVRGVVIGTILCMGPVVVERNACDLPAICSGAFHDSILLCLVGVTKGVMAGAFEFSGKIAFYTCDGDGFQRVDITKHLDGGSIGFVSDLEGNLSGSGLFKRQNRYCRNDRSECTVLHPCGKPPWYF